MPVIWTEPPPGNSSQPDSPPVALVEASRLPASLPVTQSAGRTQEIACRLPGPPGAPTTLHAEPSPVGSVEVRIRPSLATITQSDAVGQETARNSTGSPS